MRDATFTVKCLTVSASASFTSRGSYASVFESLGLHGQILCLNGIHAEKIAWLFGALVSFSAI